MGGKYLCKKETTIFLLVPDGLEDEASLAIKTTRFDTGRGCEENFKKEKGKLQEILWP